jgi:hypothetical protein
VDGEDEGGKEMVGGEKGRISAGAPQFLRPLLTGDVSPELQAASRILRLGSSKWSIIGADLVSVMPLTPSSHLLLKLSPPCLPAVSVLDKGRCQKFLDKFTSNQQLYVYLTNNKERCSWGNGILFDSYHKI